MPVRRDALDEEPTAPIIQFGVTGIHLCVVMG
jgi:hypothetical protein